MRKIKIVRGYNKFALGSCLFCLGNTKVLCNATFQTGQPPHLHGTTTGWITAEYAMLPQAGDKRNSRQQQLSSGRTKEISRIIGRSLRAVVDMEKLGPNTIIIDCDVLQADGGTRTAAINGAFIALYDLCKKLLKQKKIECFPIKKFIASISVGIVDGEKVVDLCKEEDNNAEVDMTLVATEDKELVELQYTSEKKVFELKILDDLLNLGIKDILKIINLEKKLLKVLK
ncbi:MAG: ribonuclease PH [Endomicrobiia bacterium]